MNTEELTFELPKSLIPEKLEDTNTLVNETNTDIHDKLNIKIQELETYPENFLGNDEADVISTEIPSNENKSDEESSIIIDDTNNDVLQDDSNSKQTIADIENSMTVKDMRTFLRKEKIPTQGSKNELARKIWEFNNSVDDSIIICQH